LGDAHALFWAKETQKLRGVWGKRGAIPGFTQTPEVKQIASVSCGRGANPQADAFHLEIAEDFRFGLEQVFEARPIANSDARRKFGVDD
jgi:hypothetical protein